MGPGLAIEHLAARLWGPFGENVAKQGSIRSKAANRSEETWGPVNQRCGITESFDQ